MVGKLIRKTNEADNSIRLGFGPTCVIHIEAAVAPSVKIIRVRISFDSEHAITSKTSEVMNSTVDTQ